MRYEHDRSEEEEEEEEGGGSQSMLPAAGLWGYTRPWAHHGEEKGEEECREPFKSPFKSHRHF